MRFILDTNVVIPLQDLVATLTPNLAHFVRLANLGGHRLVFHPASEADIQRDPDATRRRRTLLGLNQYTRLQAGPPCPWNTPQTSVNDACDNEILYSLECNAAHALVTEDRRLHRKAITRGLGDRVYFVQEAEDWLRRLHERADVQLPNIEDVEIHTLTAQLNTEFFDSLRQSYNGFNRWFATGAQDGRKAWIYRRRAPTLDAICIYDIQTDEVINDHGDVLAGRALKLCTFKVGLPVRGRKIGELFLKAAFRYATANQCEHIFIDAGNAQVELVALLKDFGFRPKGRHHGDRVFVKRHPVQAPAINLTPLEYVRRFYPHYRSDLGISKFLIPIKPQYHDLLFPDFEHPGICRQIAVGNADVGNAIKLAYLSHAVANGISPGDIVLFYRSFDVKAVTTLGVVERFEISSDADEISQMVKRRTVYTREEIEQMAAGSPTKVVLFRVIGHLPTSVTYEHLRANRHVRGHIQSTTRISDDTFSAIRRAGGW